MLIKSFLNLFKKYKIKVFGTFIHLSSKLKLYLVT